MSNRINGDFDLETIEAFRAAYGTQLLEPEDQEVDGYTGLPTNLVLNTSPWIKHTGLWKANDGTDRNFQPNQVLTPGEEIEEEDEELDEELENLINGFVSEAEDEMSDEELENLIQELSLYSDEDEEDELDELDELLAELGLEDEEDYGSTDSEEDELDELLAELGLDDEEEDYLLDGEEEDLEALIDEILDANDDDEEPEYDTEGYDHEVSDEILDDLIAELEAELEDQE